MLSQYLCRHPAAFRCAGGILQVVGDHVQVFAEIFQAGEKQLKSGEFMLTGRGIQDDAES